MESSEIDVWFSIKDLIKLNAERNVFSINGFATIGYLYEKK